MLSTGYVVVFADNNSIGTDVWFDNVQISHFKGQVLEENHYYPFGLMISQSSIGEEQPYKLTSKELEKAFDLNIYDFGARQYDMQIGRWTGIDPLADMFTHQSPYVSMDNNPVLNIDPDGSFLRVGAWWRNIVWGGDGIAKDKKSGEWGVNLHYTNTSGETEINFVKTGSKPKTLDDLRQEALG